MLVLAIILNQIYFDHNLNRIYLDALLVVWGLVLQQLNVNGVELMHKQERQNGTLNRLPQTSESPRR